MLDVCFFFLSLEPVTGTRSVPPRCLHDVGPEAPHVHPAICPPTISHGSKRLPRCSHARAWFPSHVWTNGYKAGLHSDEDAGPTWTQARWGRPQPAQHTTAAAPAPATVTAGTHASRLSGHGWKWYTAYWFLAQMQPQCFISSCTNWMHRLELCNCPWGWQYSRSCLYTRSIFGLHASFCPLSAFALKLWC